MMAAGMGRQGEHFVLLLLYFSWVSPCSSEHSNAIEPLCFHGRTFQLWHLFCLLCLQTFKSVFADVQIFFFLLVIISEEVLFLTIGEIRLLDFKVTLNKY